MARGIKLKQVNDMFKNKTTESKSYSNLKSLRAAHGRVEYAKRLILYQPGCFLDFAVLHEFGHFILACHKQPKNIIIRETRAWLFASLFVEKKYLYSLVFAANKYLSTFKAPPITKERVYNYRKNWSAKKGLKILKTVISRMK